jgi:hypothetical protein
MFVICRIHKCDEKNCLLKRDIPQPAGIENAEDAVTDIHIATIISDHHTESTWQIYANI